MADTKTGRERKGRNKMAQLESKLNSREIQTLNESGEPPAPERIEGDFLTDPSELDD